jgi:hypothetical protein
MLIGYLLQGSNKKVIRGAGLRSLTSSGNFFPGMGSKAPRTSSEDVSTSSCCGIVVCQGSN